MLEKTILIVDDDQTCLEEIRGLLSKFGYRVNAHSSIRDLHAKIKKTRPDIVLLGIQLDEKSRFQIADELAYDPATSHIPIIAMTEGSASRIYLKFLHFIGIKRWLTKPAKPRELVAQIQDAVNEKEGRFVQY